LSRCHVGLWLAVVASIVVAAPAAGAATPAFEFVRTAAGQPDAGHPRDAASDASGAVLVLDNRSGAVLRFAPDGTRTTLVPPGGQDGLEGPRGLTLHGNGSFDVTDAGRLPIRRYSAGGNLTSTFTGTIAGQRVTPTGIASVGDTGLLVGDAGADKRLLRFSGAPGQSIDPEGSWSVLVSGLTIAPGDIAMLGDDRVLATFPQTRQLALFDAANGAVLASFDGSGQFGSTDDVAVVGDDVLIADGAQNRVMAFPGMAAAEVRTFPTPVAVSTAGKAISAPGCVFATSASPAGLGICAGAFGGTEGTVDLYRVPPSPTQLLAGVTETFESSGNSCSGPNQTGAVVAIVCSPRALHSIGGGALASLLLAAGGAIAAATISADDDLVFVGAPVVITPRIRAVDRRTPRSRTVRVEPGQVVSVGIKPKARLLKKLRHALRRHKVVRHRLVITLTDKATGERTKVKRTIVVRRRKR
jgi:hypothetical protein